MNSTSEETEQERAWGILYDRIVDVMQQFGTEDYRGRADYLIVDDNYGHFRHKIEIQRLHMIRPDLVQMLRALLRDFPDWEIVLAVDVPGTEGKWPPMGVTIRHHEVVDGLRREFLPREFEVMKFVNGRPGTGND
jgi:hypothetical protein